MKKFKDDNTSEISDAFKRGYAARLELCGWEFNPFKYGAAGEESRNHASWQSGWLTADAELPELIEGEEVE